MTFPRATPEVNGLSTGFSSTETTETESPLVSGSRSKRRKTSHLKEVPATLELRESLRDRCADVAARLDRSVPLTKDDMEQIARRTLQEADLPEGYLGWTMVMLSSSFWQDALSAVPPERRLFLLPHCLKHAEGCPAEYDQFGMNCKECGACSIADFRGLAEDMGYRVLVAEGSPVVMKIIVGGYVDAVVGVACLNVFGKSDRQSSVGWYSVHGGPTAKQRLSQYKGGRVVGRPNDPHAVPTGGTKDAQLCPFDAGC